MIELLKEIILDFQNELPDAGIKRHLKYELVQGKAFVCIGVRRCGKSTRLHKIIDDLKRNGVNNENILCINFFDDRLMDIKRGNLSQITEAYFSIYPEKKGTETLYCFFDEIQEADNWEPFVDRILRTERCEVFISGASAKMLSKELASQMRGRSIAWELFPFPFSARKSNFSASQVNKLNSAAYLGGVTFASSQLQPFINLSNHPVLQAQSRHIRKTLGVAGNQSQLVLNCDSSDSEARLAATDTAFFEFGFQYTEHLAAFPVKRQDIDIWEDLVLKCL